MLHTRRRWQVGEVESPEDLARKVTETTWTLCTGFWVKGSDGYLFLNDSTSEDAVVEFAVIKGGLKDPERNQIESITFGWCSFEEALEIIQEILKGDFDDGGSWFTVRDEAVQSLEDHGTCHLCA